LDHLGAQAHDQDQRLCGGLAEDFVAKVDAIGAGDLWRLMGGRVHLGVSFSRAWKGVLCCHFYDTVFRAAEGFFLQIVFTWLQPCDMTSRLFPVSRNKPVDFFDAMRVDIAITLENANG
jgi:hypothetical protein